MYKEVKPSTFRGLAAGNIDIATTQGSPPKLIDTLKDMTPATIKKTLEYYEAQIVKAPIEHAVIITAAGEVYHCTGDLNTLDTIVELGEKLRGAYITHNHPVGSDNDYSFSAKDRNLFTDFEAALLHGIDERFVYELNRDPTDVDNETDATFEEGYVTHITNIHRAKFFGYGYRRWLN